jgi:hypothetical protein
MAQSLITYITDILSDFSKNNLVDIDKISFLYIFCVIQKEINIKISNKNTNNIYCILPNGNRGNIDDQKTLDEVNNSSNCWNDMKKNMMETMKDVLSIEENKKIFRKQMEKYYDMDSTFSNDEICEYNEIIKQDILDNFGIEI